MTRIRSRLLSAATLIVLAGACGEGSGRNGHDAAAENAAATNGPVSASLVPASADLSRVNDYPRDPRTAELPDDSMLAAAIRRGFELVIATDSLMPDQVGNAMTCANCHLNAGQRMGGIPWVGIAGLFPVARSREQRLFSLEDRIRGCFLRSMNGTPPAFDDPDLLAISAYISWLSDGQPVGVAPEWRGQHGIAPEALLPIEQLDPEKGAELYAANCVMCHGADGQGVQVGDSKPGPLWGPGSWNDGAGMSRVYTAAGFIRYSMPLTAPGSLSDEEAQHVAAYINSKERPVYPNKAEDYPQGPPVDAVYYPRQFETNPLRR